MRPTFLPTFFPTFFPSPAALRRWFAAHHDREAEVLIGFYYRRIVTWYVVSAKKPETRLKRLAEVVGYSTREERLPFMESRKSRIAKGNA